MNGTITRGGQSGVIAKDGQNLFKTYDLFCNRHPKPIKMHQTILEEVVRLTKQEISDAILKGQPKSEDKILVVMGKSCRRCFNYAEEGSYIK